MLHHLKQGDEIDLPKCFVAGKHKFGSKPWYDKEQDAIPTCSGKNFVYSLILIFYHIYLHTYNHWCSTLDSSTATQHNDRNTSTATQKSFCRSDSLSWLSRLTDVQNGDLLLSWDTIHLNSTRVHAHARGIKSFTKIISLFFCVDLFLWLPRLCTAKRTVPNRRIAINVLQWYKWPRPFEALCFETFC